MEVYRKPVAKPRGSYTECTPIAARAWERAKPCLVARGLRRDVVENAYIQVCRMSSEFCSSGQTFTDIMEDLCRQIRNGSLLASLKVTRR